VSAQSGSSGLVFEVVEQWGWVQEVDRRDAQGHHLILEDHADTAIFRGML